MLTYIYFRNTHYDHIICSMVFCAVDQNYQLFKLEISFSKKVSDKQKTETAGDEPHFYYCF